MHIGIAQWCLTFFDTSRAPCFSSSPGLARTTTDGRIGATRTALRGAAAVLAARDEREQIMLAYFTVAKNGCGRVIYCCKLQQNRVNAVHAWLKAYMSTIHFVGEIQ